MISRKKIIISFFIAIIILFLNNCIYASTLSSDINSLNEAKYPGIKKLIQNMQSAHPSWKFQVEYTGLDFNSVIINECQGHGTSPTNLSQAFNSNYSGKWICPICGTKLYDSEKWYCASETALRYMIDPRNSINENDIFQFLDLSYTDNSTINTVKIDMKISGNYFEIIPSIDYNAIKQKYANCIIKDLNGKDITGGNIATGQKIVIDNKTYTILKKGDVNKDGNVNIVDVVNMLNSITGKVQFDAEAKSAGLINSTDNINIVDVVNVLNSITGKQTISLETENNTSDGSMADGVNQMAKTIKYLDSDCIQAIINVSNKYKINPLYLMARIYQEQGAGTSPLANGSGYSGQYSGYYNLFNIGATGSNKDKVILNGLAYAKSKGWTSKVKSIEGGAETIANSYINKNQDTLYYQKFNVVGTSEIYTHQYMQNILAAQSEGRTLRKTYLSIDSNLTNTYVFTIPLYENMPTNICERPDTNSSYSQNYVTKTVSVTSSLLVRDSASSKGGVVTSLKNANKVKVLNTTEQMIDGHYWSLIVCEATGAYGYVASEYLK